jgi:hypothetical protein
MTILTVWWVETRVSRLWALVRFGRSTAGVLMKAGKKELISREETEEDAGWL